MLARCLLMALPFGSFMSDRCTSHRWSGDKRQKETRLFFCLWQGAMVIQVAMQKQVAVCVKILKLFRDLHTHKGALYRNEINSFPVLIRLCWGQLAYAYGRDTYTGELAKRNLPFVPVSEAKTVEGVKFDIEERITPGVTNQISNKCLIGLIYHINLLNCPNRTLNFGSLPFAHSLLVHVSPALGSWQRLLGYAPSPKLLVILLAWGRPWHWHAIRMALKCGCVCSFEGAAQSTDTSMRV